MLSRALVAVFATFLLAGCNQAQSTQAIDRLTPCTGDDTPVDAYCGTLKVYEDRASKQGRQIDLNIVVLPALRADAQPDPLVFLAGGPGQGAAKMAKMIREAYRQVLTDRDIVLVDQRGTGKSNPLDCEDHDDSLRVFSRTDEESIALLKKCLAGYDADLRWVATPGAVGYKVYWRDAWANDWQRTQVVGNVTQFVLPNVSIDDYVFGVAAIGSDGHESLVSAYVSPNRPMPRIKMSR